MGRLHSAQPSISPVRIPVKPIWSLVAVLCVCVAVPAHAQESAGNCKVGNLSLNESSESKASGSPLLTKQTSVTSAKPAVSVSPTTAAERQVQNVIAEGGLHVVHFWAPWCSNSKRELKNGWTSLIANNPTVTFTFVTVWNDGETDAGVLDNYNLPDRVTEVAQPDLGPSNQVSNRRRSFLTHPVSWVPSTWIFHNQGELAFALNYGEMEMSTLQSLLNTTRKDW